MKSVFSKKRRKWLPWQFCYYVLFSILFLFPFRTALSFLPDQEPLGIEQVRYYRLAVTTRHNNNTYSYFGLLELTLNATGLGTYHGRLTWNLTWDKGHTWSSNSDFYTYASNRSYQFAGLSLYTAWWIPSTVQIGDQIRIDGDAPATNNFLRTAPFVVTDLISLQTPEGNYLCWQLSYITNQPQMETYYYECQTGILVRASSIFLENNTPIHEAYVELSSATPSLPKIQLFLHYWINYHSLILALIGATLVTLLVYYVLQHLLPHHTKVHHIKKPRQNA